MPSQASERLQELLRELHAQLAGAERVDPALRDLLHEVEDDIHGVLEAPDEGEVRSSLVARLSDLALRFETDHPTIAGTINQLTHALSSMGI
jgi:hypothetical protein